MACAVHGAGWPDRLDQDPVLAERTGIDLNPLDPTDPDARDWLRACVWPEHTDRMTRLDAALAEAAAARPRVVTGDLADQLPRVLAATDDDLLPVVFSSNALLYPPPEALARVVRTLAEVGARRDLAVVLNESASRSVRLLAADAPPTPVFSVGTLTLVCWRDGVPTVETLGETGAHGGWLSWRPRRWPYRPGPP